MQQGYYSTAWSDIKNSPGWFAKVCLLGLINFIPVFGSMVCYGYSYGWARDIAWNVHQPMPARLLGNEDGKLYSRGFFALVIFFVASIVSVIPGIIIGDSAFSSLVVSLLSLFLCMFAAIGVMRMAIYGRISAGFQVKKMWSMMTHDFNGLLRILGMVILAGLIIGFAFGIGFALLAVLFVVFCMLAVGGDISMYLFYDSSSFDPSVIGAFAPAAIICLVLVLVLAYITSCASCWLNLLQARATGPASSMWHLGAARTTPCPSRPKTPRQPPQRRRRMRRQSQLPVLLPKSSLPARKTPSSPFPQPVRHLLWTPVPSLSRTSLTRLPLPARRRQRIPFSLRKRPSAPSAAS